MKSNYKALPTKKENEAKRILIIGMIILVLQIVFHLSVGAKSSFDFQHNISDSIKSELDKQLNNTLIMKRLNFPKTVKRFYTTNLSPIWLRPEDKIRPTISAMLLLDCVRQYGLQRKDYHPGILTYALMYNALNTRAIPVSQKVEFELMLTDAMISMINHLHYGVQNPYLNAAAIDNGLSFDLKAEDFLSRAINSPNVMDSILTVQPKIDQYKQLQEYMKLIAGQYTCDSYETPEEEIRTIAINMERLRWREIKNDTYLHINIPSFKLTFFTQNVNHEFKIVVGKASTPTPTLTSEVTYLETAPDWLVPQKIFVKELLPKAIKEHDFFKNSHMAVYDKQENIVSITTKSLAQIRKDPSQFQVKQSSGCDNALGRVVFRFNNKYDIYLHDTPEQQYFERKKRAFSHGCIRVKHADVLASLLLESDNQIAQVSTLKDAMINYNKQKFVLKTPLPILITYLTITVENGLLVRHEDLYQLDRILKFRMYAQPDQLNKTTPK